MATEQEETELGFDVERHLVDLIKAGGNHGSFEKLPIEKCENCKLMLDITRRAIRARIADRPEPAASFEGTPFPPERALDDPKPQHIFTRRHVSDLREVPQGVEHTSEHSLSWLMDTSPEGLLKLERLSNTVYVLLGHRDPEKLAAWINRAHDIANRAAGL